MKQCSRRLRALGFLGFRSRPHPDFLFYSTRLLRPPPRIVDFKRHYLGRSFSTGVDHESTIYALSTAPGRAAIAIIRISGSACSEVYQALCPGKPLPKPRYATLSTLYEPGTNLTKNAVIDPGALILHFAAPNTVTGEDVLELHIHGGTAVVKAVLAAIPKAVPNAQSHYIRYAEPGEFTRRAFYNNRLDLLQIEALGDTLSAETEQQRRLAVRGSTSILAEQYESWRPKLLYARGELEALIDFSEDQHFDESPAQLCASVASQVSELKGQVQANIQNASRGELLRNGINIALVGAPNAGKSSLLNQIVGREAAIVSSEAGTTRDVVDVNVDIGGFFCRFGDLAGLRKGTRDMDERQIGEIEQEGMRRAKERALSADVVIAVFPASVVGDSPVQQTTVDVDTEVVKVLEKCDSAKQKIICVLNKADLFADGTHLLSQCEKLLHHPVLKEHIGLSQTAIYPLSCKNAREKARNEPDAGGIQVFLGGLTELFIKMTTDICPEGQTAIGTNSAWAESLGATERQRTLLYQCLEHLDEFLTKAQASGRQEDSDLVEDDEIDIVLAAESLRSAADCLAKITGKGESGDVEQVLGVVFEK